MIAEVRENVYTCRKCGGYTVTVDRDEGVTPFIIQCRASGREGDCNGKAESAGYPPPPRPAHIPAPEWEWRRPTAAEILRLDARGREHFNAGGLFIRRIPSTLTRASKEPEGYVRDRHGSLRRIRPRHG